MKLNIVALALLFSLTGQVSAAEDTQDLHAMTELPDKPMAQDFTLPDTEGNTHTLSEYRGKPVIVNFWATWCRPCRKEMPSMQRAWEQMRKQGVMLLAISVGDREEWIPKFRASLDVELDFPLLLDNDSSVASEWSVKGLPVTYVVGPQGHLVYVASGEREWDSPVILEKILALKGE